METRILDAASVERSAAFETLVPAMRAAFGAYARGDAIMPAKSYIDLPQYNGDFRAMPAYLRTDDWDAAGIKWVNSHPDNPDEHDLPAVMGVMIYSDPETALPLAIMDGTSLTRLRTGAAAGLATDLLADPDARSLGIIGAGAQAYTQLEAIASVRSIDRVVVSDVDQDALDRFIETFEGRFSVEAGDVATAASCDILSTVTPVREPIVPADVVTGRLHINAMGADAPGKQELSPDLVRDATIVIDDYEQCTHSGEINVPWNQGLLDDDDIYAELGALVVGERPIPTAADGITIFDSTGLAIQDVVTARIVYEAALDAGAGHAIDLLGLG